MFGIQAGALPLKHYLPWFITLLLILLCFDPSLLWATHDIDHRFKVYGHVKDAAGNPIADGKVIIVALRNGEGSTVFTNKEGYYEVILHLHNADVGDTIEVTTAGQKKKVTASFDPTDRVTERKAQIDFGVSETKPQFPVWIYGVVALFLLGVAVSIVVFRKRKRLAPHALKGSPKKKS